MSIFWHLFKATELIRSIAQQNELWTPSSGPTGDIISKCSLLVPGWYFYRYRLNIVIFFHHLCDNYHCMGSIALILSSKFRNTFCLKNNINHGCNWHNLSKNVSYLLKLTTIPAKLKKKQSFESYSYSYSILRVQGIFFTKCYWQLLLVAQRNGATQNWKLSLRSSNLFSSACYWCNGV